MNKKIGIIVGALVVILLLGGGYTVLSKKSGPTPTPTPEAGATIGTLSADEIGLKIIPTTNNQKVKILVEKASDIKSLDYEITYEADTPASEKVEGAEDRVQRGFTGEATLKGEKKYESKEFDLGSCSRNVCRYDTGVEKIEILMKVTKKDGKIYQVEDSITLE
jgi:hypothetical protein